MMKQALFLSLLLGLSFPASCVYNATDIIMSEQGTLIAAVIGLVVVVIALAYTYGTVFHNAAFLIFAKDELYHLGFSILLLLGFTGIVVFSCDLTGFFFGETFKNLGTSQCYAEGLSVNSIATCYVDLAEGDARGMAERYTQKYISNLMDSTWSVSIAIPLFNAYTGTAGAYRRVVSNEYNMVLSSFLVPALMSISMQKFALVFITENIIRWILPTAFALRFFPATRHMGNIFIALALGLYVLVPLMYTFNLAMYDVVFNDCNAFAKAACDNFIDNTNCASNPAATCGNPDSFWNVARLIPQAFFLPNLTIAIVITFLASIHKALRVIG
jgi:hypothetical protein